MNKQSNKVEIPIPNTKFTMIGKRQQDNTWTTYLNDPEDFRTEKLKENMENNKFKMFCSLMFRFKIAID